MFDRGRHYRESLVESGKIKPASDRPLLTPFLNIEGKASVKKAPFGFAGMYPDGGVWIACIDRVLTEPEAADFLDGPCAECDMMACGAKY